MSFGIVPITTSTKRVDTAPYSPRSERILAGAGPTRIEQLREAQAAMGAALVDRTGDQEALRLVVAGIASLGGPTLNGEALRQQAVAEARERRVAINPDGVAGTSATDAPSFDEWVEAQGVLLPEAQRAALQGAYEEYSESIETLWSARDEVLELDRASIELAPQIGQEHLDTVEAFWTSKGVPLEIDGHRVRVKQWDEPGGWSNAYYDPGKDELAFGRNGSGAPMSMSLDIVAHEYGHRVVRQLIPGFQRDASIETGAIDESMADVFAAIIDPDGDWSIAEDITTNGMRDMDTQALTLEQWRTGGEQNAHMLGVVPNGAAWRIGSTIGREAMGDIYINALPKLGPAPKLIDLARAVVESSIELHGADSAEAQTASSVWADVLGVEPASLAPTPAPAAPNEGTSATDPIEVPPARSPVAY